MRIPTLNKNDKTEEQPLSQQGLPREVHEWLDEHLPGEEIRHVQYADLHGPGHFGDAWVIATDRKLVALRWDSSGLKLQAEAPLEDVESLVLREFVGNGRLDAVCCGRTSTLCRFTRSLAREVEESGRVFAQLATEARKEAGRPAVELTGDVGEHGAARCAICGRVLRKDGVCPDCMNRTQLAWRMLGFVQPYRWYAWSRCSRPW